MPTSTLRLVRVIDGDAGHPDLGPDHECHNSHGTTFQPGQVCFGWAALQLANERTPQPWHADYDGPSAA